MRKYADADERAIRALRLLGEWLRSGLIDAAQHARLAPGLAVDLRRTNLFLRLTLFVFGLLIIAAAAGLVMVTIDVNNAAGAGAVCLVGAAASIAVAEWLTGHFRLYRFGIEEACAMAAVALAAVGSGLAAEPLRTGSGDGELFVGLAVGAAAAFAVYRRFGYVYAAIVAMLCAGVAPFELGVPPAVERSLAAAVLAACVAAARVKHRRYGDEYPGDEYGVLQAAAVLGFYAALNLQLFSPAVPFAAPFYWFTFAMMWIVPAVVVLTAIRERDRRLLDAGLVTALATLVTNKPYLGLTRHPWDPILLGILLIGGALILRRWLASGDGGMRRGYTATRILHSDRGRVALAGIASGFRQSPAGTHHDGGSPDPFEGSGGRSGGGGADGSF